MKDNNNDGRPLLVRVQVDASRVFWLNVPGHGRVAYGMVETLPCRDVLAMVDPEDPGEAAIWRSCAGPVQEWAGMAYAVGRPELTGGLDLRALATVGEREWCPLPVGAFTQGNERVETHRLTFLPVGAWFVRDAAGAVELVVLPEDTPLGYVGLERIGEPHRMAWAITGGLGQ